MATRLGSRMPLSGRRMTSLLLTLLAGSAPRAVEGSAALEEDVVFAERWFDIDRDDGNANEPQKTSTTLSTEKHAVDPVDGIVGAEIANVPLASQSVTAPKHLRQARTQDFAWGPYLWQKTFGLVGSGRISPLRNILHSIYNLALPEASEEPHRLMEEWADHGNATMQGETREAFTSSVAHGRSLSQEASMDDSQSIIEFVGTDNVENYEWSHYIGGMYTKTRILHRPNWQKTVRCSDNSTNSCTECWGQPDCWAPCSGSRCAQTSATNSSWARLVNTVHVQCSSGSIMLQYEVMNTRGGSLQMFLDGEEISKEAGFDIKGLAVPVVDENDDYQQRVARLDRVGSVLIPVGREGGHQLDIQFTSFGIEHAGVELSRLRLYMPNSFAECEDFKVCLDPISGNSEGVQMLRNNNALQLACLEEPVAISESCAVWRGCLTAESEIGLYTLLKAASVDSSDSGASSRRLSTAESSKPDAVDLCIDPAIQDAEAWTCDCLDEMRAQCANVHATEEICLRAQMCGHARVCEEWKQMVNCDDPQIVSVLEALSMARRLTERHVAVVDGTFTRHGEFDRSLRPKRC